MTPEKLFAPIKENEWPSEIDDQQARKDWNWQSKYDLNQMTKLMLEQLEKKYKRTNYN